MKLQDSGAGVKTRLYPFFEGAYSPFFGSFLTMFYNCRGPSSSRRDGLSLGSLATSQTAKPMPRTPAASITPIITPMVPNKGNLTIGVGSFKDQGEADARAARLRSSIGSEVLVSKGDIPGKGIWYRVYVGKFASREAAMSYGNYLRSKNLVSDFIVTSIGK